MNHVICKYMAIPFLLSLSISGMAQISDFSHLSSKLDQLTTIKIDSTTQSNTVNSIIERQDYNGFSHKHLGAMCKLENTINKSTVFPVAIRLGTVQYVDRIEGKVEEYAPIKK